MARRAPAVLGFVASARHQGKAIHFGIGFASINFLAEKLDLFNSPVFLNINEPGPQSSIGTVAPAIAALLELMLEIERSLRSPNPHRLLARFVQQQTQHRPLDSTRL